MTTIIIFWSALMALTFFILQAGFNMLAALTDALYSSLIRIVSIILLFIIGFLIIGTALLIKSLEMAYLAHCQ